MSVSFFLIAGHFANEVNFLSKLLIITNTHHADKIPAKAELTQALFVSKMFAGKLYEGWVMIEKYYFGTVISKKYNEILKIETKTSIKQLSKYFGKVNHIYKVRNSYSFHYGPENIGTTLREMEDEDEFDIFIADQHINSLYYVSESVINKAMFHELEPNDLQRGFDKLYQDIIEVHGLMIDFINGL